MGKSLATISQKQSKGRSAKLSNPDFFHGSVISSCSCKVLAPPAAAELNGSLTQSRQSVGREGRKHNSFGTTVCRCPPLVSHSAATCHFWVRGNISRSAVSTCQHSCNFERNRNIFICFREQVFISALHSRVRVIQMSNYICRICQS